MTERSITGAISNGHERRASQPRRPGSVRIAAVGDFHCGQDDVGLYRELFARVNDEADVLVLTGDLTRWGALADYKVVVGELTDVTVPIVAVLGNHDYESGQVEEGSRMLRARGVHLLCGDTFELNPTVGFAGVKGFMGGFGRGMLTPFGEPETKAFVKATLSEVHSLELALRRLSTPVRVAVLHYAPIAATIAGEPDAIQSYLGTDRLAEPLDRYSAAVAFHGHAHSGTLRGATLGGVPVFNVSLPLLRKERPGAMYYVYDVNPPALAESQKTMSLG
ncbi:MAG TPA: metallophosphoesterase [Gemmatimonadaceae bacterium]|nr:metallophosphoesterase [Gemmatimonadaceae bacterium]